MELALEYSMQGHLYLIFIWKNVLIIVWQPATVCTKMLENEKRVSPVHKGDVKTDPNNFRHLYFMYIYQNFLEKTVPDQVSAFKENAFLNDICSVGLISGQLWNIGKNCCLFSSLWNWQLMKYHRTGC